eukprot:4319766-Pyramimonas_sp.AAC.2
MGRWVRSSSTRANALALDRQIGDDARSLAPLGCPSAHPCLAAHLPLSAELESHCLTMSYGGAAHRGGGGERGGVARGHAAHARHHAPPRDLRACQLKVERRTA